MTEFGNRGLTASSNFGALNCIDLYPFGHAANALLHPAVRLLSPCPRLSQEILYL
jgi:hypothetical protein